LSNPEVCACAAGAASGLLPYLFDKLVAPALVALVFGGSAAYVLELYRGRREAATKVADTLREYLDDAQELIGEYWSRPYILGDEVIEAKIIGLQSNITVTLALLDSMLKEKFSRNLTSTSINLIDALTGGDFQSKGRGSDPARISICANFTAKLKVDISRARYRSMSKIWGA
jgi:hypothetical protein